MIFYYIGVSKCSPNKIYNDCRIFKFLIVTLIASVNFSGTSSQFVPRNDSPYYHKEILDTKGNYTLSWYVDFGTKTVTFNVSATCKGYVGFGLAKSASISGSDFAIGGIDSNGTAYLSDMHGVSNDTLELDKRQDWKLLHSNKEDERVQLSFSRTFDTCDEDDHPITDDLLYVIWAYGDTDETSLEHPIDKGFYPVYLLDPDSSKRIALGLYRQFGPHSNTVLVQQWRPMTTQRLPPRSSSQICSIIKGPRLTYPHKIDGGGAYLPFKDSRKHVRQIILTQCTAPEGVEASAYFEPFVKNGGEDCYFPSSPTLPKQLCTRKIYVWGYGGKPYYFPEDVGMSIGNSPDEFYLLEIHYNNADNSEDLEIKAGLELVFSPRLRPFDGAILTVNYGLYGFFTVPPRSATFSIYGHCSSECMNSISTVNNGTGIHIFAVMLQMRSLGSSIRLRHFRGNVELPWILKDDNYNYKFQQTRQLPKQVEILPGDQLTVQCTYDTSAISSTTFSGFSDNEEQCSAHIFVNQPISNAWCSSEYPLDVQLGRFDLKNFTWDSASQKRVITSGNGTDIFTDVAEKSIRWSPSIRAALQREILYGQQMSSCPIPSLIIGSAKNNSNDIHLYTDQKYTSTPFSSSTVSLPTISSEYKIDSECHRSVTNSFAYRNVLRSSYNANSYPKIPTISDPNGGHLRRATLKPTAPSQRSVDRFPRIKPSLSKTLARSIITKSIVSSTSSVSTA